MTKSLFAPRIRRNEPNAIETTVATSARRIPASGSHVRMMTHRTPAPAPAAMPIVMTADGTAETDHADLRGVLGERADRSRLEQRRESHHQPPADPRHEQPDDQAGESAARDVAPDQARLPDDGVFCDDLGRIGHRGRNHALSRG